MSWRPAEIHREATDSGPLWHTPDSRLSLRPQTIQPLAGCWPAPWRATVFRVLELPVVICSALSLGSSRLLPRSACVNILGRADRGAGSPLVGKTIDTPRGRSGAAVCHAFLPEL